ncbi:MAG: hypothetical protein K2H85_09675, partial [Allobaculum sp.]|nr:hypothetical protein [Allobaculum sp.]
MQDLIQMLEEYKIKNVISIDDGWGAAEDLEKKIERAGLNLNVTVKDFCETYSIEIPPEEEGAYKECSYILMEELENIREMIPKAFIIIQETLQDDIDATLKALKSILNQLDEKFNICIGGELENSYQTLDGNTLYILDKDMGSNRENEFLDYLVSITDKRKTYNDLIIVYSNEVSGLLEHDKK